MKILLPFFLICSLPAFAQSWDRPQKNILNSFVEQSSVSWAAYSNDTTPDLHTVFVKYILPGYRSGKLKAAQPIFSDEDLANGIMYIKQEDFISRNSHALIPVFDSLGNVLEIKKQIQHLYLMN